MESHDRRKIYVRCSCGNHFMKKIVEALDHAPGCWDINSDEEVVHQAIFLTPSVMAREAYMAVGEARAEYETGWSLLRISFFGLPEWVALSITRWFDTARSSVSNKVIIRNASTVKRLRLLSNG